MKQTVFVGLSGGVDSSVAALRLKRAGHDVVGVFIKVWHPEWMVCNWEAERLDAMRVAAHLDIPFLTCDATTAYKEDVADYFIEEYRRGRTPNPDVMCNQAVKFGAFLQFAKEKGAAFVATGHYAQKMIVDGKPQLHRGVDKNKDQSYFLWTLTESQLSSILLPVGDTPKEKIRKEAAAAGIPVAAKKDSQGICFLGHVDIPEFLSHYIDLAPGDVLSESSETIGTHQGAFVYTIGQRHGFTIHTHSSERTPYYVLSRDIKANTITVSTRPPIVNATSEIVLDTLTLRTPLKEGEAVEIETRYRQTPVPATLTHVRGTSLTLSPQTDIDATSPGQSCVLYRGTECLGGGIIT